MTLEFRVVADEGLSVSAVLPKISLPGRRRYSRRKRGIHGRDSTRRRWLGEVDEFLDKACLSCVGQAFRQCGGQKGRLFRLGPAPTDGLGDVRVERLCLL